MCGIAGLVTQDGSPPPAKILDRMTKALEHRGPDGQGQHLRDGTALIQTRLAIIDLETGDQPLYADNRALVANGEIYNYVELRQQMSDVSFATGSDCETPLHLYLKHGLGFVEQLRGMYSIAIDDPVEDCLILTRDPFGIKPIYYAQSEIGFIFASEISALVASGTVQPKVNADKQFELLQLQFTTGPETLFEGVYRMLPGETLVVRAGQITERTYQSALRRKKPVSISEVDALKTLDQVLENSVDVHQRSDVPYGMFLSGGVDSSVLLAMMARLNERPVQAFTIGFSGTEALDERDHARVVARATGAEFIHVEFDEQDFWTYLPRVCAAMDDPAADYAVLPTFKLAQTAHQSGLKVILSGEGGDELFGGYSRYRRAMRPRLFGGRQMRHSGIFDGLGVLRQPGTGWRDGIRRVEAGLDPSMTRLQKCQATDCADWLPNDLLNKLDRCLMAHAIEGRVPFLDREVAGFAFNLPDALKVKKGTGKWLLKKWLEDALPEAEPFSRKRGFTVPVGEWISREGKALGPLVAAQLGVTLIANPGSVEALFNSVANNGSDKQSKAAWTLLYYALWHQFHMMGRRPEMDVFASLGEA